MGALWPVIPCDEPGDGDSFGNVEKLKTSSGLEIQDSSRLIACVLAPSRQAQYFQMASSQFVLGGRKVLWSDLVLTLEVAAFEGCGPFVEANRSRIDEKSALRTSPPNRHQRAETEDRDLSFHIVLSLSTPPGQSRSQFILGRDPKSCDIICTQRNISNQHIKFCVEDGHIVLYDVSSVGSQLSLGGRGFQWTSPAPGTPYRCILPPGCQTTLKLPGNLVFLLGVPLRAGAQLQEFRKKHDAFLANCSDLGALNIASQVPTQLPTPSGSARERKRRYMYWFESKLGRGSMGSVHKVRRLQDCMLAQRLSTTGTT